MSLGSEHEPFKSVESGNLALVQAIKRRPCLYNNTLSEYTQKNVTRAAWQEIADEFGCSVDACKRKWKSLRTVYAREMALVQARKKRKPYYLVNHMDFLAPFLQSRPVHKYRTLVTAMHDRKYDYTSDIPQHNSEEDSNDASSNSNDVKAELANTIGAFYNNELNVVANDSVNKRTVQPTIIQCVKAEGSSSPIIFNPNFENPRRQFILSMLPEIEEMTEKQFRNFKRRMFQMIDDILLDPE